MVRLHKEIERIKKQVLSLGAEVEERVEIAVKAIETRDDKLAQQVIEGDPEIDNLEVDVEEECLKVLALHQPVAIDLRVLIAALKINNDLERVADLACDIAEQAQFLATRKEISRPFDFPAMSQKVMKMLRQCLDAFVHLDEAVANEVCFQDDEVDDIHKAMFGQVKESLTARPDEAGQLLSYLSVSRYLERIADHTTNIAEDVIYLIKGNIVRHTKGIY
jgi:phosphate transport system protein